MLSTYRVLDLTDERGDLAGHVLAGLGAEVIAIEPPGGTPTRCIGPFAGDVDDPERSLRHWSYNRGKRSVVLDFDDEADRDQLKELARGADILIECGSPGELAALGLGYGDLQELNPSLVYVSITPFGQDGPKADWAVSDITLLAAGGQLALTGDADRPPLRVGLPQAYLHGSAEAAGAALIALHERNRSGLGQHVDVSVQQAVLQATQSYVLSAPLNAVRGERSAGSIKAGDLDLRLSYPCIDGYVSISLLFGDSIGPFTRRLFEWIHEEGMCTEADRDKDWIGFGMLLHTGEETTDEWDRIKLVVEAFTLTKTKKELLDTALERRLLIAPMWSVEDVDKSEQLAARNYWETVEQDGFGPVKHPGPIAKYSATPLKPLPGAPRIGQHTDEVLAELAESPRAPTLDADRAVDPGGTDLPLSDVKILDFMWAMAGPAYTRVLADYGAQIVRLESSKKLEVCRSLNPFRDDDPDPECSGIYHNVNAGKLGMTIDMANPLARDVICDLIRWADVVTEAFSPKAMRNWSLGYDDVRKINPDIIMVSTCLMGQTGPMALYSGFGNLAAALSGFHSMTGWPDRPPAGPFSAYTDYVAPRFTAAAVVAAIDHRRRTGEGQYLDFSQAEAATHFLTPALLDYTVNGRVKGLDGNTSTRFEPHGVYPTAGDDRWVAIVCETDHQRKALAAEVGCPLDDDSLAAWTADQDGYELEARLQSIGVAAHVVQNSDECWVDPQLAHRGHYREVDFSHGGTMFVEGSRFKLSRTPAVIDRPGPTLGEHSFQILTDILGYDGDRIAELAGAELLE